MINANYFDGQQSIALPVTLILTDEKIKILSAHLKKIIPRAETKIEEPFQDAPLFLYFSDGSHCEILETNDKSIALQRMRYQTSLVERWQYKWHIALIAVIAMGGGAYFGYQWGAPLLANTIIQYVPQSVDDMLGRKVADVLDRTYVKPSEVTDTQYIHANKIFHSIQPKNPRIAMKFDTRKSEIIGPNALALPNGSIFITDEMLSLMIGKDGKITEEGSKQLAGLLAHEIAHVELRHGMKGVVQASILTIAVASVIGDFSTIISGASTVVLNAQYSQATEAEADEYAIKLLKKKGISPAHLANLFVLLENYKPLGKDKKTKKKKHKLPEWMDETVNDYVSSHPSTKKRIARFKQASVE